VTPQGRTAGAPSAAGADPPRRTAEVTWWGHACVLLALDDVRLLTDPVLVRRMGPLHYVGHLPTRDELAHVDAVLISHLHHDHLHLRSLALLPPTARLIVPLGAAHVLHGRVDRPVEELGPGDTTTVGRATVTATSAAHDGRRHPGGPRAATLGFVVSGTRTAYFAGDTELFPEMADEVEAATGGSLDLALIPVGGWGLNLGTGHMDPREGAEAVARLRPRHAVPVHWGSLRLPVLWRARRRWHSSGGPDFARLVEAAGAATSVRVLAPGERFVLPVESGSTPDG
jgi:L-ascorbate metabolism protein UlaG (beta-lactamase superfamily)